jgi:hypothetical protein
VLGPDAHTRSLLNPLLVQQWLHSFRRAKHGRLPGTISREGLYRRVVTLLSLEMWLRDHRLTW